MIDANHLSAINAEAFQKFTPQGFAREFPGLSLVQFISTSNPIFPKVERFVARLQQELVREKLIDKLAFLPKHTYHVTVIGIVLKPTDVLQQAIVTEVDRWLTMRVGKAQRAPNYTVHGAPKLTNRETIILRLSPLNEASQQTVDFIRNGLHNAFVALPGGEVVSRLHIYRPHLTLAYIIKPFSDQENQKFMSIMQQHTMQESFGELTFDTLELRRFVSMEDWGIESLATFKFDTDSLGSRE